MMIEDKYTKLQSTDTRKEIYQVSRKDQKLKEHQSMKNSRYIRFREEQGREREKLRSLKDIWREI